MPARWAEKPLTNDWANAEVARCRGTNSSMPTSISGRSGRATRRPTNSLAENGSTMAIPTPSETSTHAICDNRFSGDGAGEFAEGRFDARAKKRVGGDPDYLFAREVSRADDLYRGEAMALGHDHDRRALDRVDVIPRPFKWADGIPKICLASGDRLDHQVRGHAVERYLQVRALAHESPDEAGQGAHRECRERSYPQRAGLVRPDRRRVLRDPGEADEGTLHLG